MSHRPNMDTAVIAYLETLAKTDGGYGWEDQETSHLSVAFSVVCAYHLLGQVPPQRDRLVEYINENHPFRARVAETRKHIGDPRKFVYQQIQGLLWLGGDPGFLVPEVKAWVQPQTYPKVFEPTGLPVLKEQALAIICRRLLGLPEEEIKPEFWEYFQTRQRDNGSYNNTPATDGSDGHLLNTWWSLLALSERRLPSSKKEHLTQWIQACQLPDGSFTYQPNASIGATGDLFYTLAGINSLHLLHGKPNDSQAALRYILSLANTDGGFAHRPGEPSCPMACCYALSALATMGELHQLSKTLSSVAPMQAPTAIPEDLHVYSIQIQAPGFGSPREAALIAKTLHIDLWGAKNSKPGWIEKAQQIALDSGINTSFYQANEESGTYVTLPGLGIYSHVNDPTAPTGVSMGPTLPNPKMTWDEFYTLRLDPLSQVNGRMIWQICDNEEFSRILLDESLQRDGYKAITTFHFACWNMASTLPFLWCYRHRLPFVALQDAHGTESWWWSDQLAGYRTLFLAKEPTWEQWLQALDNNWVVAVRHDAHSADQLRMLGGAPGVQNFVRAHQNEWKWWQETAVPEVGFPPAMISILDANDEFEAGSPSVGAAVRIRCRWKATDSAALEQPLYQLKRLEIDGAQVPYEVIESHNRFGSICDHYYVANIPQTDGGHKFVVTLVNVKSGETSVMTITS